MTDKKTDAPHTALADDEMVAHILARYAYGEDQWAAFDPEERWAVTEPYLRIAKIIAPMLAGRVAAPDPRIDKIRALVDRADARADVNRRLVTTIALRAVLDDTTTEEQP